MPDGALLPGGASEMLGAIAGDIIGSVYESRPIKTTDFPLFSQHATFTDDTVLTIATAYAIINGLAYGDAYRMMARAHPYRGYGGSFDRWFQSDAAPPYHSYGNGSAMRVSPVGWAFDDEETILHEARASAAVTHNHPEGIRGAQATALAVYLARTGMSSKDGIRRSVQSRFGYDLQRTVDNIRPGYGFKISCQETVPEALICFFDAEDYESTVRNAVSLGGDSDTLACIAGSIAEAFYGPLPEPIRYQVDRRLPEAFREIITVFAERYMLER